MEFSYFACENYKYNRDDGLTGGQVKATNLYVYLLKAINEQMI